MIREPIEGKALKSVTTFDEFFDQYGHASIQTTMNVYGQAMPETKRKANSKIVQMVMREPRKPTGTA